MKIFISTWLSLFLFHSQAATYGWSPSPTPGVEYVIYAHTNALSDSNLNESVLRMNVGTNLTATIKMPAGTWYIAVSAILDGDEALCENQLSEQFAVESTNRWRVGTLILR